jgi:hypothetical protein
VLKWDQRGATSGGLRLSRSPTVYVEFRPAARDVHHWPHDGAGITVRRRGGYSRDPNGQPASRDTLLAAYALAHQRSRWPIQGTHPRLGCGERGAQQRRLPSGNRHGCASSARTTLPKHSSMRTKPIPRRSSITTTTISTRRPKRHGAVRLVKSLLAPREFRSPPSGYKDTTNSAGRPSPKIDSTIRAFRDLGVKVAHHGARR